MIKTHHYSLREEERGSITGKLIRSLPANKKELKKQQRGKSYTSIDYYSDGRRVVREGNVLITVI